MPYPQTTLKNSTPYQYQGKIEKNENPVKLVETKYKSPETKNYPPPQFSQTNPFNMLS